MNNKNIIDLALKKLNKETDMSWSEINDILGLDYHRDTLRRMAYGIRIYDEYIQQQKIDNVPYETLQEIEEKLLEIQKERRKLSDKRSLVNRKVNELARIENMIDIMRDEIQSIASREPLISLSDYIDKHKTSSQDGCLLISDMHYGINIDSKLNTYNSDVCKSRISYLVSKTIEHSKLHNIDKLHLFLLGDLISGEIHSTIRLENQENLISQIMNISQILSESISILASQLPYVVIHMTDGNHERVYGKDENLSKDNYTSLIKFYIKSKVNDLPNVVVVDNEFDDGIIVTKVCDNTIFATHGDKETLNNAIPRLTSLIKRVPDYLFMGHYHNVKEDTYGECEQITNGTFSGTDSYAKDKRLHSIPTQKFMIFNKEGRLCTYNIRLN